MSNRLAPWSLYAALVILGVFCVPSVTRAQAPIPPVAQWHGVNLSGLEYGAGGKRLDDGSCPDKAHGCWSSPPANTYDNLQRWGFTVVRLPVSWANLEPIAPTSGKQGTAVRHYNADYLATVDREVNQLARRGIYVVISMHQVGWSPAFRFERYDGRMVHGAGLPGWLYPDAGESDIGSAKRAFFENRDNIQQGMVEAWRHLAQHFSGHPHVIAADLINEPNLKSGYGKHKNDFGPPVPLDGFYRKLAQAIREVNPQLRIVFEDSPSTPVNGPPVLDAVYSFHLYNPNWKPKGEQTLAKHVARARQWKVPLWIGEFHAIGPSGKEKGFPESLADTRQMLRACEQTETGWAYWAYHLATRPLAGEFGQGPINQDMVDLLRNHQ